MITAVLCTRCAEEHYFLFNVFILNTLDVMKFNNIARNSCEVNLVTVPIMHIRNVIKTRTSPPPNEVV